VTHDELYAEEIPLLFDAATEVYYRCPSCNDIVASSERQTDHRTITDGGTARFEECPSCDSTMRACLWERVPYGEVYA